MSGFFCAALKEDCIFDLFYGTDYHSHLGTRRAGLALYGPQGFQRSIHNIENAPFRTKFTTDVSELSGNMGIGCISDYDPQPLVIRSHLGPYAIACIGKVNNTEEIMQKIFSTSLSHLTEMSHNEINKTELTAFLIDQKPTILEGIQYAQEVIDGSMSIMLMTKSGIYLARDKYGRTPIHIGKKEEGYCASFESYACQKLGYSIEHELGPAEVDFITPDGMEVLAQPQKKMRICTFLWTYYGYSPSSYEGTNVEQMRYNCGKYLAQRDFLNKEDLDTVAGVPDSGIAHAIGYSNESKVPYSRPFIKYTPTWPRSFMPTMQSKRNLIAKMKLIPVEELVNGKRLLLIDDSIVRGTQLRETAEFLYDKGSKEVHVRPACPPLLYGCKYLNFSRSTSEMELITRQIIAKEENTEDVSKDVLAEYANPDTDRYHKMLDIMGKQMGFSSLQFARLDDTIKATGLDADSLCTYCWTGKE